MIALGEVHVVFMVIGQNLIKINMKKYLSSCNECGDDTAILVQVSAGPEAILLCTDCYNFKYLNETQKQIDHVQKEKI